MNNLISSVKQVTKNSLHLPFSIYCSVKEQRLLNVPILKPLLIVILKGHKQIGKSGELALSSGEFIFLSDSPETAMRNIPKGNEYLSLLIEFDHQDFKRFQVDTVHSEKYVVGKVNQKLQQCLYQFIEWSPSAPPEMWCLRREEIIQLLYYMGYKKVLSLAVNAKLSHKLHGIISENLAQELSAESLCKLLAMSESTLRRRLVFEGTSLQAIKDQAKMGHGLHLIQTTHLPISTIAEKCGYQSPSRFSDRFKQRFGLTPLALRKTKLAE